MEWKVNDQVVVRRNLSLSGPRTHEVRVGQIAAFADGETAVVNLALPGGRSERKYVKVSELAPVSQVYGRSAVQLNPLHRQVVVGF